MNLFKLVVAYLKARPLNTLLNILLLSLGIAMITLLLVVNNQVQEKIADNSKGIDLVVGAKGSPLQLILCNVFHIDFPTGNIKLQDADKLAQHRLVKSAIPMALGDSYRNYRIIGTTHAYATLYHAELASGMLWNTDMEVTLGANVAEQLGLKLGDKFVSAHGLSEAGHAHEAHPFIVKGILQPTFNVLDNLILTNVSSIWLVHAHDAEDTAKPDSVTASVLVPTVLASDSTRELTSLLIKYRNPIAAIQLPRYINSQTSMQAASPSFEAARLFSILGVGIEALTGFAYVLIFISALSIFLALYNSLKERRYDLAIMRSMGASRSKLLWATQVEGITLTLCGSLVGILLGHGAIYLFTTLVAESATAGVSALVFYEQEFFLLAGSLVLGIICSVIPSWQAYRTDIHNVLAGN
ncbi:MAG: ABC transporter permease [Cyclobacteriaceae bacterium]|nr:ABC transporter permease [Cyclobacteriaceae bacterium]